MRLEPSWGIYKPTWGDGLGTLSTLDTVYEMQVSSVFRDFHAAGT